MGGDVPIYIEQESSVWPNWRVGPAAMPCLDSESCSLLPPCCRQWNGSLHQTSGILPLSLSLSPLHFLPLSASLFTLPFFSTSLSLTHLLFFLFLSLFSDESGSFRSAAKEMVQYVKPPNAWLKVKVSFFSEGQLGQKNIKYNSQQNLCMNLTNRRVGLFSWSN